LRELVASRHDVPVNRLPEGDRFVVIHGRQTAPGAVQPGSMSRAEVQEIVAGGPGRPALMESRALLLNHPWEILSHAQRNLARDLVLPCWRLRPLRQDPGRCIVIVGDEPVLIGRGVTVHPHVVFDTSGGPILLDSDATVRSMSVMVGPGYVGQQSIVCNHAHIRSGTVIGPHCKVGGEVNGCLFQGSSNKAHSGYLGDTFVGEWVNLGADTVTSNLKNTYGQVRMQTDPDGEPRATGLQFLGSVIGDYVKTAIGTRLATGTCIHSGAMLAVSTFPPKCVARFAFLTDDGDCYHDLGKFMHIAQTVMQRRGQSLTPALRARLAALYEGVRTA
jgi:UDP-N-acetylglucosamine diphosphorylase / glucose-1-phosphate thymidylyltransferase / UDP-N-acetylgalactosamine diphosphorylase / glucosamine-1-phosphate N-acetyltransferase / galactosamine-1-phosphate N-acetyltransferase